MAYTPELTAAASGTLRRIAWATGQPMTKTMNTLFTLIPKLFDKETVCNACKDKSKCELCGFGKAQVQADMSCIIEENRIQLKE